MYVRRVYVIRVRRIGIWRTGGQALAVLVIGLPGAMVAIAVAFCLVVYGSLLALFAMTAGPREAKGVLKEALHYAGVVLGWIPRVFRSVTR